MTNLKLLVFAGILAIALSALCSVPGFGDGTCIDTSKCSRAGGKSHRGYCSGGNNIQCCTNVKCGNNGICKKKGTSNGSMVTGLCPGDASFVCYKDIPCGGNGKCLWSGCNGNSVSGKCPGPNGFKCCLPKDTPQPDQPIGGKGGEKIASAARSQVGKWPYSWGGGDNNGATYGSKQDIDPYCDDRSVKGFDCSGLAKYAVYQGTGISLPHRAKDQFAQAKNSGKLVSTSNLQPGDLVFFGSSDSKIHHVAIYVGNGNMVEAPGHNKDCSGRKTTETKLRTKDLRPQAARFF